MSTIIPAFLDGHSLVFYDPRTNRLYIGNSEGLVKIFNPDDPNSEPISVDIPEDLTALTAYGNRLVLTNSEGHLALVRLGSTLTGDENYESLYQSNSCLRDAVIINEGNRILCGGDSNNVVVMDCVDGSVSEQFSVPDLLLNIAYNAVGELVALSLCNGDVHIYSVVNEKPELVEKISAILPSRPDSWDGNKNEERQNDVICTSPLWSLNGEHLLVPTSSGTIKCFNRTDWSLHSESSSTDGLTSIAVSPNGAFIALLEKNGNIKVLDSKSLQLVKSLRDVESSSLSISIAWANNHIFVSSNNGELRSFPLILDEDPDLRSISKSSTSKLNNLFLDEASESDSEDQDQNVAISRKRNALDDSMIIDEDDVNEDEDEEDEDDDMEAIDGNGHNNKIYENVDELRSSRQKRAKFSSDSTLHISDISCKIVPYSPGATPWMKSLNSGSSATKRRYLFMNSIGYSWSVKNASLDSSEDQKSVTISFFDRSINKDYHFIDYYDYDLCSMNERGVLLGCSGYENELTPHKGRLFYRHHVNTNDSWDRQIPLLKHEYITSICITSSSTRESGESIIVVGTSLGYLRFFNLYGLCINLMKVSPIVSLISSAWNYVFIISQTGRSSYTYSLLSATEDFKFYQQERSLPLTESRGLLLKGLFFNEFSDPCVVAGEDDTLIILSHWREVNNARWIPVLNYTDAISDFGLSSSKKNWRSWPLGLSDGKSSCLVLKNNDKHPGFPLPLPIELHLKLPVKCWKSLLEKPSNGILHNDDVSADGYNLEAKLEKIKEEDPEEEYLRASTLGKLLASSIQEMTDEEDSMETLRSYSVIFDKSLLKLFNSACQESRLNKAFSVVRLLKNDKALLAATKIAERHNFSNLVTKINKLREDLLELQEDTGDQD